jgi:hypothetical protein
MVTSQNAYTANGLRFWRAGAGSKVHHNYVTGYTSYRRLRQNEGAPRPGGVAPNPEYTAGRHSLGANCTAALLHFTRTGRLRPTHEVCVICKGRGVKDRYFSIWETLGDLQDEPARRPAPLVVALLLCRRRL